MSNPIEQGLGQTVLDLKQSLLQEWRLPDPESAFAYLLCSQVSLPQFEITFPSISWPQHEAFRHPQSLAAFGFMISANESYEPNLRQSWLEGLKAIVHRDPFPIDRQSFAFRPIEVLGLANGAAIDLPPDSEPRRLLLDVVCRCRKDGNVDVWSQLLYAAAEQLLRGKATLPHLSVADCTIDECALIKGLAECEILDGVTSEQVLAAEDKLLEAHGLSCLRAETAAKVGLHLIALAASVSRRIRSRLAETGFVSAETLDAMGLVTHLCSRFPLFARELRNRRKDIVADDQKTRLPRKTIEMTDEYDVQDALRAILKLFFDDVRPEEWTPSYAGKQARMDFLLKAEKIVIETKFFGSRLKKNDLIDQLIVDKEHYSKHEDCRNLVCLIYDPELKCDNPIALERELSESKSEDYQVVVVVCPKGL